MVMTSVRLQGKENTSTRYQDTCRCLQVEGRLGPQTKRLRKQIKKTALSSGFRQQAGTIAGLLRDCAMMTINRSWGRMRDVRAVINDIIAILQALAHEDLDEEDYDPYDGTPWPPGPLDPAIGAKGLGLAGEVPIPMDIWNKHVPSALPLVLANLPDQGDTKDAGLAALASRMCDDGLLVPDAEGGPSTFRAFAKSTNALKGALIADPRAPNPALIKPIPFKLPSLSQLGNLFSVSKTAHLKLFFTKLDISNMYWACKVPNEFRRSIRF